jgi:D-methionine transport system permease protein
VSAIIEKYFPHVVSAQADFIAAFWETVYMTFWAALIGGSLGIVVGVVLLVTRPKGLLENCVVYEGLTKLINIVRAIPFIILLALLAVTTRFLVGTTIGAQAALVPMIVAIVPFFARQIENALLEVDQGVIEAAEAMGTSPIGIIFRVYLLEGLPSILRVAALTIINVIGLTAMAGAVGAGGLGNLAIARGYNRFQTDVTLVATLLLLLLVFVSQFVLNTIIKKISH